MDQLPAFVLGVVTLLSVPGPTNTLLAASGAAVGLRRSMGLVPAEIGGYLVAIGCLLVVVAPLTAASPLLPIAAKFLASIWLAWSALVLWRSGGREIAEASAPATPARLFVTTLLNPKALVFAFVIFPQGGADGFAEAAAIFSLLVAGIGTGWIVLGQFIARSAGGAATPRRVARLAAVALALFATLIAGSAVAGLT
jgi:threonine/homoserine/homoserine lactone efflux protein